MQMKMTKGRKRALISAVAAVVLGAGAAFAFFTTTGDGTGTAQTGTAAHLTITQIGAGYDSLASPAAGDQAALNAAYTQDQCFQCAQITDFGNAITLANPGYQRLVSATVAFRNWGAAIGALPITLTVGGKTDTETVFVPAVQGNGRPTTFNVTFNFSLHPYIPQQVVYDISFNNVTAPSLNVALSNSANELTVGTDTNPGTVLLSTTDAGIGNTFPACSTPVAPGSFISVSTNCGLSNINEPGAYGNTGLAPTLSPGGPTTNADIPAVEINVLGGVAAPLYPGGPAQPVDFAITNPSGGPQHVGTVTITLGNPTLTNIGLCNTPASAGYWYRLQGGTLGANAQSASAVVNANIPPGTTYYSPSGFSTYMWESGTDQSVCENAAVNLVFSSN